jgi:hypothetical protein
MVVEGESVDSSTGTGDSVDSDTGAGDSVDSSTGANVGDSDGDAATGRGD